LPSFGEKLRKQREQRGIALETISNTTKISTRMLRALEEEHFGQLPGGVFNKGFVRAYARQVGLDEDEAVTDYLAALRESQILEQSILPDFRANPVNRGGENAVPPRPAEPANNARQDRGSNPGAQHPAAAQDATVRTTLARPPEAVAQKYPAGVPAPLAEERSAPIPWGKLALALLLVAAAVALWNLRRQRGPATAPQPSAATTQTPLPAPAHIQPPTSISSAAPEQNSPATATSAAKPSAAITSPTSSPSPTTSEMVAAPANPAAAAPLASSNTTPAPPPLAQTEPAKAASQAAFPAPSPVESVKSSPREIPGRPATKPATPAGKPFNLLIRVEKTTWILVTTDGQTAAQETLIAPAHTSVRASREIVVRAGNAAGISFLLNGSKEIPAEGRDGEVKTYVFDAHSVRVVPSVPAPAANR
jgi:cytoskeletal protein RodZ